ncbi:hypothetical protein HF1_09410 [Mycoplasma haemofelis str. Langford 1]|uniref:Uncharacterized protein n=1 Tax=Mycoplasma haemofelis (strain Langford 1) TaxID=941640 RepID=E8ZIH8_MYCHL|nr:hypothetical protein [Mycoplasma haemofelis]CBY92949.1 hypothetical protein HF1_09410 [Mycoplasma haemofelis str. Langford 1]
MGTLAFKGLAGTAAAGTVATGGFFAWKHVNEPTDVRSRLVWEGQTVADVNKDGVWRAIYLAKHNENGFSAFVSGSNKTEVGPRLKQKCSDLLSVSASDEKYESAYKDAQKWCLKPELTTIEMQFDFEDREFASGDDDFKNLFVLNKETEAFVAAVKSKVDTFTKSTELETAKTNVKTWCEDIKLKTPEGDDLKNAKAWCAKPIANLSDFMDTQGFKSVEEGGWDSKFSSLNTPNKDSSLSSDIASASGTDGAKLKAWCEGKHLKTSQIHSLQGDLEKIKNRCFVRK